jgi:hypothetical protein
MREPRGQRSPLNGKKGCDCVGEEVRDYMRARVAADGRNKQTENMIDRN